MLELKNIFRKFGKFKLGPIDLELNDKEYFVILGPSGAGKTVFLEMIAGLCFPEYGEVVSDKKNITTLCPENRDIGLVYQDFALFPAMNVRENIIFGLKLKRFSKHKIKKQLDKITDFLKINDILDRDIKNLSGGEKQRVALARALILEPKVLLLDEPLSSLDPALREKLRKELKKIHSLSNTTFIQVTHDFEEAVFLADRIALMRNGQIEQIGRPEEIMQRPVNYFAAEFVGVKNIMQGIVSEDKDGVCWFQTENVRLQVSTDLREKCYISIAAEDILISKNRVKTSARNSLQGKVVDIIPRGRLFEVIVDAGEQFVSLVTKQSIKEMDFKKDSEVWLIFKTSEIHVF